MKTLYLLRHAKSSWDDPNLSDYYRPLSARGMKAAPMIGKTLVSRGFMPDVMICSPAERARQTVELVRTAADADCKLRFDQRIYGASTADLLEIVSQVEPDVASAMLVGHNPTFENVVRILTGSSETMPTASLAVIDLEIADWHSISPGCGSLRQLIRPKDL